MSRPHLFALVLLAITGTTGAAQDRAAVGTIVVAHGGDSAWNALVVDAARRARTGGPVEVSFLMGPAARTTRFQDVVSRLQKSGVSRIVVVPMLVSSHSGHYDQVRYLAGDSVSLAPAMQHHLHVSGIERPPAGADIRLARAMDDAPHVARVVTDRARALTADPGERAVLIVGHGPNSSADHAEWMVNLRRVADSVRVFGGFRDVRVGLVRDDAPAAVRAEAVRQIRDVIELQYAATGRDVVVVPVLVSKGTINRDKLPRDLAGLPILYSGEPLLPHPEMVRWIESAVKGAAPVPAAAARQ
jgi:sirohydrochlorin ferrochelatase